MVRATHAHEHRDTTMPGPGHYALAGDLDDTEHAAIWNAPVGLATTAMCGALAAPSATTEITIPWWYHTCAVACRRCAELVIAIGWALTLAPYDVTRVRLDRLLEARGCGPISDEQRRAVGWDRGDSAGEHRDRVIALMQRWHLTPAGLDAVSDRLGAADMTDQEWTEVLSPPADSHPN
ncbi:hypothetical protein AB0F17_35370 [Nonomuraea sp. NPDC026600]|uniref:hypothetical protein n=1 Tax=Nonomuraea sp. NPDC026600 TaxID=3155363 RepID=UPI0033F6EBDD